MTRKQAEAREETPMSESAGTPRTDAAYEAYLAEGPTTGFSPVALCRTLERELADRSAELDEAKEAIVLQKAALDFAKSRLASHAERVDCGHTFDGKAIRPCPICTPSPAGPDALAEEIGEARKLLTEHWSGNENWRVEQAHTWIGRADAILARVMEVLRSRPAQGAK
jgi:hypothetical protein